jgi:mannan endo-1,4-beta-mannosidase
MRKAKTYLIGLAAIIIFLVSCHKSDSTPSSGQTTSGQTTSGQTTSGQPTSGGRFQVQGRFLEDSNGNKVILRGVDVPIYASGWSNDLSQVASAIAGNTKANAVRMLWYSSKVFGQLGSPPYYASLSNLDNAISAYLSLKLLPIVYLGDLTAVGDNTISGFNNDVVPFWTSSAVVSLLKKYNNSIVINLENEWGATWDAGSLGTSTGGSDFVNTYTGLITQLRNAGITAPIMIDAPDGGSNSTFLLANGQALVNADPIHNILLSVHTYWTQENGAIQNCPGDYTTYIDQLKNSNLPFILGEVSDWAVASDGSEHNPVDPVDFSCPGTGSPNKYAVNYDAVLTEAVNDQIGFFAWAWYQDGLAVRNIYDQGSGTSINTSADAGTWPADILRSAKPYGLNNGGIVPAL